MYSFTLAPPIGCSSMTVCGVHTLSLYMPNTGNGVIVGADTNTETVLAASTAAGFGVGDMSLIAYRATVSTS